MTNLTSRPLPHDALLTLARKTEAAAADADHDRLAAAARRLLDALLDHIEGERSALARLAADERPAFTRAQRHLVDLVVDLLVSVDSPGPCHCPDLTRELVDLLEREADDERLRFAHDHLATRSTAMGVTERLRREHAELRPRVASLDDLAADLGQWDAGSTARLREIVEFLQSHLLPHARAEEAVLYPAVEDAMQAPGATDTMKADHHEIVRRTDELATFLDAVGSDTSPGVRTEQLRAQLYGLSAILQLHFAKEEDVLLPVLDGRMTAADATRLFERMSAVAHPHE